MSACFFENISLPFQKHQPALSKASACPFETSAALLKTSACFFENISMLFEKDDDVFPKRRRCFQPRKNLPLSWIKGVVFLTENASLAGQGRFLYG